MTRSSDNFTEEQVIEIRERYAGGDVTQAALGEEFGVTGPAISYIVRGISYPQYGGPRSYDGVKRAGAPRKLTDEDVSKIRTQYAGGGVTQLDLAIAYNLCTSYVNDVLRGKTYKCAGGPVSYVDQRGKARVETPSGVEVKERNTIHGEASQAGHLLTNTETETMIDRGIQYLNSKELGHRAHILQYMYEAGGTYDHEEAFKSLDGRTQQVIVRYSMSIVKSLEALEVENADIRRQRDQAEDECSDAEERVEELEEKIAAREKELEELKKKLAAIRSAEESSAVKAQESYHELVELNDTFMGAVLTRLRDLEEAATRSENFAKQVAELQRHNADLKLRSDTLAAVHTSLRRTLLEAEGGGDQS